MPKRLLGAVARLVEREYGGAVAETEAVETVGTTSAAVTRNDPERPVLVFVNLSANTIFLGFDASVSSARGIRLAANGGALAMNARDDLTLPTRRWFAVATAAASNLYVLSVRRIAVIPPEPE